MIKIVNKDNNEVDVFITGDITADCDWHDWYDNLDVYPQKVRDVLNINKDSNLNVRINSGGGDVFSGFAIHNMLKAHKGKTKAIIEGLCASSASIIAFGCDEIEMPKNTFLMIHKPSSGCYGDSTDFRKMADTLDTIQKGIVNSYKDKKLDCLSEEALSNMIDDETWMTGEDAAQYFDIKLVDKIEIENKVENINAKKIPPQIKSIFSIGDGKIENNTSSNINDDRKNKDNLSFTTTSDDKDINNISQETKPDDEKVGYINKIIVDTIGNLI